MNIPIGIIKGSEHALSCPEGVLDRSNYSRLPPRSNPNFANQRKVLYDIFEVYTKLKRQRRHQDVADRYDLFSYFCVTLRICKQHASDNQGLAEPEFSRPTDRLSVCVIHRELYPVH